jgi:hypothetical protein
VLIGHSFAPERILKSLVSRGRHGVDGVHGREVEPVNGTHGAAEPRSPQGRRRGQCGVRNRCRSMRRDRSRLPRAHGKRACWRGRERCRGRGGRRVGCRGEGGSSSACSGRQWGPRRGWTPYVGEEEVQASRR